MKILIIDDHALIREGIAVMVQAIKPDTEILQAGSCAEGLTIAAQHDFDFAFLDLQLPDQPGFVALEKFREQYPSMSVIVISGLEDKATVLQALDLGAKAFVPKSSDSGKIRDAIRVLLEGRIYLPESVTGVQGSVEPSPPSWNLTPRQQEVLALLLDGLPNKLIARRLAIEESTVKIHVSAILRELKVASRTQALIAVARSRATLPTV